MRLALKIVPKASRDRVVGWVGDRLKLQVQAPPERGRANDAATSLLAETLGLPRDGVRIVAGLGSPQKLAQIDAPEAEVYAKLPPR